MEKLETCPECGAWKRHTAMVCVDCDRSAGRWCARCEQHGNHHTDRHDEMARTK